MSANTGAAVCVEHVPLNLVWNAAGSRENEPYWVQPGLAVLQRRGYQAGLFSSSSESWQRQSLVEPLQIWPRETIVLSKNYV